MEVPTTDCVKKLGYTGQCQYVPEKGRDRGKPHLKTCLSGEKYCSIHIKYGQTCKYCGHSCFEVRDRVCPKCTINFFVDQVQELSKGKDMVAFFNELIDHPGTAMILAHNKTYFETEIIKELEIIQVLRDCA